MAQPTCAKVQHLAVAKNIEQYIEMPPPKSGSKKKPNNSTKKANVNARLKFLSQQEITNMMTMKKEFETRKNAILTSIQGTNKSVTHLNHVIRILNAFHSKPHSQPEKNTTYFTITKEESLLTPTYPYRINNETGILLVGASETLNPRNIVIRELVLEKFEDDFQTYAKCSIKRHFESPMLSDWRGTQPFTTDPQKYTIDSSLLYGKSGEWSVKPLSWKNVPNSFKANLDGKTLFKDGSTIIVSYSKGTPDIIGVFKDYTERDKQKEPDLIYCEKQHWIKNGLLYDENPDKGWEQPADWPKIIPYIEQTGALPE